MIHRVDDEDEIIERPFNMAMFMRLLGYLKPYRSLTLWAVLALSVGAACQMAIPLFTKVAINRYILPKQFHGLVPLGLALAGVYLVRYVSYRGQTYTISRLGQEVVRDLRSQLFHHIHALNFTFFDRVPAGKIYTRVLSDVSHLSELLSSGLVNTIGNWLTLCATVVVMLVLKPSLALISFLVLPLLVWLSTRLQRRIVERWRVVRRRISLLNATWAESLNGARVVTVFGREAENQRHFQALAEENRRVWLSAIRLASWMGPSADFAGTVGTMLVFAYGTFLYLHHAASLGLIVAFVAYLGGFWGPISQFGQFYNQLLVAMASAERIFEYLDQVPQVVDRPRAVTWSHPRGQVIFDRVSFAYAGGPPVLHEVSFAVEAGQTVALVGPTGSGKSSILSLLPRFYDVTGGRILLDGRDIRDYTLASLRRHMALVLQETFIFDATIADNIRYSRPEASDAAVMAAAEAVGAHTFIEALPEGYYTRVRERGARLSLGQRQLLALARAILADPAILILDEATASIDTQTELVIQAGLQRLLHGRTAFVVAHRLSTIREADVILVVNRGRIVERGTHEELLARQGAYWDLIAAQFALEKSGGWFSRN
ncbi:MAG: ABC transporter ATP-binding protein [Firmicutes bacterium]|nr:ABC transporter ATP-binding protein [Bacillota bacterium]